MPERVSLGYHTVSDDCVTSAYLHPDQARDRIIDMLAIEHHDVDYIWLRNEAGEVIWEWRKGQENS